jgi:hypothetical protein
VLPFDSPKPRAPLIAAKTSLLAQLKRELDNYVRIVGLERRFVSKYDCQVHNSATVHYSTDINPFYY